MAKKTTSADIKKLVKSGHILIGTDRVVKSLRLGKVQKVLMSSNCPSGVEKDIMHYAGLSGAEFEKLEFPNDELGVICKKPFSISVLALPKGASK